MTVINFYLARLFLARFLILLLGLGALILLFDFLANGDEVIESRDGVLEPMLRYSVLRLPSILSQLIPIAVLVAALVTLLGLVRHSELIAMRAAGQSQLQLVKALLPVGLLIAIPQFFLEDRLLPQSVQDLKEWGVGEYAAGRKKGAEGPTWLRHGGQIVRIESVGQSKPELAGVTIFQRNREGLLADWLKADQASYIEGGWVLEDVAISTADSRDLAYRDRLTWQGGIDPALFLLLSAHPREISLGDLLTIKRDSSVGNQPQYLYDVWIHKRIARVLATVVLILLAIPLVQRFHRRLKIGWILAGGLGIGFLFWTFDGLILAVGEAGLLPAPIAAWAPLAVLAILVTSLALHHESQ